MWHIHNEHPNQSYSCQWEREVINAICSAKHQIASLDYLVEVWQNILLASQDVHDYQTNIHSKSCSVLLSWLFFVYQAQRDTHCKNQIRKEISHCMGWKLPSWLTIETGYQLLCNYIGLNYHKELMKLLQRVCILPVT